MVSVPRAERAVDPSQDDAAAEAEEADSRNLHSETLQLEKALKNWSEATINRHNLRQTFSALDAAVRAWRHKAARAGGGVFSGLRAGDDRGWAFLRDGPPPKPFATAAWSHFHHKWYDPERGEPRC